MLARRLDTYYGVDYVVGVPEAEAHIRALRGKGRPFSQDSHTQGSYRSLKSLKVLEIHHCFFKALKSLQKQHFFGHGA